MKLTTFLGYPVYLGLFLAVLFGLAWRERRKRRTKAPFPEDLRLLRMPGQYLWERIAEGEWVDAGWIAGLSAIPLVVASAALQVGGRVLPSLPAATLLLAGVFFLGTLLPCAFVVLRRLRRRANDYLGFFGERYVAEFLNQMRAKGWHIFHDMQCDGATGGFNLDHVAVGPGGVWVIETKTRRKGRARPGFKPAEVTFDGNQIIWPWIDEKASPEQAAGAAQWLGEWLEKKTGKVFQVSAVVAIPGYFVIERKLGAVRVANPKNLPDVLTGRGNVVLSPSEIDLIRRQVEDKCRDVRY
jgi:hypothetical protein